MTMTYWVNSYRRGLLVTGSMVSAWLSNAAANLRIATYGTGIVALLLLPSAYAHEQSAPRTQSSIPYVTGQGDTLYGIAARYLRDPNDWQVLARMNHLAASIALRPGTSLNLPTARLNQERPGASILAMSGPAEQAFGDGPYIPLAIGMKLTEGDRIRTGHNGFVTIQFEDGSRVGIQPDTSVDILRSRKTDYTGTTDRELMLHGGELDNTVSHAPDQDSRFQIRSPSVVAGVRGTRFRMNYDPHTHVSAVEVLAGTVGVAAPNAPGGPLAASVQRITANFGSVTRLGAPVGPPVELLGKPSLAAPGKIQGSTIVFDLALLRHARAYRVQVGRDAKLLDLTYDKRANTPHVSLPLLSAGTYFIRLSAIDANGLEGLPRTYVIKLSRAAGSSN